MFAVAGQLAYTGEAWKLDKKLSQIFQWIQFYFCLEKVPFLSFKKKILTKKKSEMDYFAKLAVWIVNVLVLESDWQVCILLISDQLFRR